MGGDTTNGFNRPAYSDEESRVMHYFAEQAEACGLHHRFDEIGNLIIETPGSFAQWIETGSHVDTVPGGGNYDGLAGIVAGFEAIKHIVASPPLLKQGLRLRIWRGEESAAFGIASIGSRAAFGTLPDSSLCMSCRGKTLSEAMIEQHADPEIIKQAKSVIHSDELDNISAYIEMHIEQGKVLEAEALDIGIVTAIRGSRRSWVSLSGTFDHSGATPMGSLYRQDCNLAMAYMHVRLNELLQKSNSNGSNLVQTIGLINNHTEMNEKLGMNRNAVSKVSGTACFSFEVRGCDADELAAYSKQAATIIKATAAEFGVHPVIETFSDQSGIPALNQQIQQHTLQACQSLDLSQMSMPSGAWHDAGTVAQQKKKNGNHIPVGMIFIPCRDGISHSPDEYATAEAIAKGTSVLATTILQLSR